MVNCEAGHGDARFNMWADMIEAAARMGWNLCVGNVSSGTVKSGQGSEINEWETAAAIRLFKVLNANPGNYLGVHEYTSFYPWSVSNGQFGKPDQPPDTIYWSKDQWHIGRFIQGINRACAKSGLTPPKVIITEGVIDDMNDIDHLYPGVPSNGWRCLIPTWNKWFPGKDVGDVLADMHIWTWEKVYAPFGFVVGIHVYAWGDASGKWANYRVDNNGRYRERMEAYHPGSAPQLPPAEITVLVDPLPASNPAWQAGTIAPLSGSAGVNLRLAPQMAANHPCWSTAHR